MLFQKTIVNKYKQALPKETTENPWQQYQQYFLNKDIQQNILQSKEEQFQEEGDKGQVPVTLFDRVWSLTTLTNRRN